MKGRNLWWRRELVFSPACVDVVICAPRLHRRVNTRLKGHVWICATCLSTHYISPHQTQTNRQAREPKTRQNNFQQQRRCTQGQMNWFSKVADALCVVLALLIFQSERNDRLDKGWLVCAFSPTIHFLNKMTSRASSLGLIHDVNSLSFILNSAKRETIKGWPPHSDAADCLMPLRALWLM